ncbi:MAG: NPCBM/NEW2 domain-containing protein, partial [Muribaculaceae bacterium]|nr:NPCBM/NEW2 domain-containing protein [Muribaculaceae bacterium]
MNDTIYYKGISNHAQGHVSFLFDRPFTRFVTRFGIQDDKSAGSLTFLFWDDRVWTGTAWTGGTSPTRYKMYSKTNSGRGTNPCIRDLEIDMTGKNSLYIEALSDGSNAGDHAHILLSRLYVEMPDNSGKMAQTVSFSIPGGSLPVDGDRLALQAEATSGGKIAYRIIQGRDLARIENGNELVPVYGSRGDIVVEATQYGDDNYLPAVSYITFSADLQPVVEMLASYPSAVDGVRTAYFLIDTKGRDLKQLDLRLYDNPLTLTPLDSIDLTNHFDYSRKGQKQIVAFPFASSSEELVHRFTYDIVGLEAPVTTPYRQGSESFDYLSDLTYKGGTGWDHWTVDVAYDRVNKLQIGTQTYAKGFGTHAQGYVESTCDLSKYERFVADVGGQTISNTTRGKVSFALKSASNGSTLLFTGNVPWNTLTKWDYKLNGLAKVYILCGTGGDGNTNDVVCVGAPRFYYPASVKKPQGINWISEAVINQCRPTVIDLEAEAESGLDVIYCVTEGQEYARIEDGNKLNVFNIPSDSCRVSVIAYQPGNETWAASETHTCVFKVANHVVVAKDERMELDGPLSVNEMTVYADQFSSGQVLVKSGLVSVEKMHLKYTFRPGEWVYMAFPSDMNIDDVSDFNEKGYYFNNTREGVGSYYISSYNSRRRSDSNSESPWETLTSPEVKGLKGYIMCVDGGPDDEPVEITFTMNNLQLDLSSTIRPIHLTLDMSTADPGSVQAVYVKPANVKGNTLKVNVKFKPADESALPVNHARALRDMRVTYTP